MKHPLRITIAAAALTAVHVGPATCAGTPSVAPREWHDVKCARYRKAWTAVLARRGTRGLGRTFLERHDAFLASNCRARSDVCPRSPEELERANMMVIMSMNFGAASTFAPFYCR